MTPLPQDNPITSDRLLATMQKMRALVEPETHVPDAEPVDWVVPHRLNSDGREALMLFGVKLAACLEKALNTLAAVTFDVRAEGIYERCAGQLYSEVIQQQPQAYYLPVTQPGKGQVGFIRLPFDTAALLVGCMLRDPDSQIGQDGQMTSLGESILLDAAVTLTEAMAGGFAEYGCPPVEKTDRIVYMDWPVRFCDLEDMCEFRFEAAGQSAKMTLSLTVLDEVIADIARIKGPFKQSADTTQDAARILKRMHDAPMQVTALLSSALMALRDILSLEEGDVVILDRSITESLDVHVNGQHCFCGWPAAHRGRLALQMADEKVPDM